MLHGDIVNFDTTLYVQSLKTKQGKEMNDGMFDSLKKESYLESFINCPIINN